MNSHARDGFYTLWTIAILICLAACLFLLAYVSFTSGGTSSSPVAEQTAGPAGEAVQEPSPAEGTQDASLPDNSMQPLPEEQITALPEQAAGTEMPQASSLSSPVLVETADLGQEYQNQIVFLGDSTTYGLSTYNILPNYQVWVPGSGTLSLFNWEIESINCYFPDGTNQSLPIAECASTVQPEYLVITLGINGVSTLDESSFKDYYLRLVQAIQAASPNTRIMCDSIFPVSDAVSPSGITNSMVQEANGWILEVVQQTGTRYLNTAECLTDSGGQLISEVDAGDGLHVTPDGYERILTYVRTHGYQ